MKPTTEELLRSYERELEVDAEVAQFGAHLGALLTLAPLEFWKRMYEAGRA